MKNKLVPKLFSCLMLQGCLRDDEVVQSSDGFVMLTQSLSVLLSRKEIFEVPDAEGLPLACDRFFDDWFVYAVADNGEFVYGLFKLREQEHDAEEGLPADGDTPGVTISFIALREQILTDCLSDSSDENRRKLNCEINRVVAYKGQRHHPALKRYFKAPSSQGSYLVAKAYVRQIASFAVDGCVALPEAYKEILQQSRSYKHSAKLARLPRFLKALNHRAGRTVCDEEGIHLSDAASPDEFESLAILATHTGNTSEYSFAAEVEYHARFLTPLAKLRIPFFGRSIYDSAIRADMTVGDTEFEGPAPFYQDSSRIVKRQYALHSRKGGDGQK